MKQYVFFDELPVNTRFSLNGNQYSKRSSRTAEIISPEGYCGTWFYFKKREIVIVGLHSRAYGF